ncbi:hypothetical protein A2769_03765 [Candidatus Daviesbacteria bacterium RIFCSPHIGHO2_01_FULL_37_27]|nr:MAG: hypothetical protein A2769_03765 [Candidatus Daviesbacteria bacterium RIFCSPHIGHO2_01_FULL_37_27]
MRGFYGLSGISMLVVVSVLAGGIFAGVYFWKDSDSREILQTPVLEIQNKIIKPQITPTLLPASGQATPVPFYELTTPYLRNRSYQSQLGALEKVSENADYTSYLTSYTSDGLKINGQLTQPKGVKPDGGWPAVVFVHGYIPPAQYKTLQNYSQYVDFLAKNSLVVFKIDLRGHADSEGESGGAYFSSDYIIDTLNAYSALQSSDFVNPEEIGLWGHSMAGNVVFRAFVAKADIPAIVIWAGAVYTYSDFSDYSISDNSYQPLPEGSERRRKRVELFETYGDFDPKSEFWKQVPGTNYLDGVNGAVQVNHAVNDNVVSIEYSRNLMKILDGTEITHELQEYPSGGHNLTGANFPAAMEKTVEFLKKYL